MRLLTPTRALAFSVFLALATSTAKQPTPHSRYPNELQGFEIYAKYLAPLRPGISTGEEVARVLGDPVQLKPGGWNVIPNYVIKKGPVNNPALGPLFEIVVKPEGVIPMAAVRFPKVFTRCHSSLSEFNIGFDVYSDTSGLEYWLLEEDSQWGKKGELFQIIYGQRRPPYPSNTIC